MAAADLKKLGLNDKRIKETLKNESLTTKLSQAAKNLPENPDKNICTLTYNLVTKAKQDNHIDLILPLILNQNILMESQLESGLKFLHKTLDSEINQKSLNNACGVGQIADENVVNTVVADVINSIKSELTQQRYKYPIGKILGNCKNDERLKFCDTKLVKDTVDKQVLALLGPKTDADNAKTKKVKAPKEPKTTE